MKKVFIACLGFVFAVSIVFSALAAEMMKGTIRGVDEKQGTITFCPEGTKDMTPMSVDKSVDMKNIKPDTKVEISVEKKNGKDTVKGIKVLEQKRKVIQGC